MKTAIRKVLETAVWAPSGDNSQPWSFSFLGGNTIRVHLDPHRDNPILNFKLSGTYIAHGALIENIILAAPLFGLAAEVRLMPDSADPHCTAEIRFTKSSAPPDPLATAIRDRHTNRKPYQNRVIGKDILNAITRATHPIVDAKLSLITDTANIRSVAQASAFMEQISLETPALKKMFVENILWTEEENRSGMQGLFIKTMELPPPVCILLHHMKNPMVSRFADIIGLSKLARIVDTKLYASAPVMGLVTIDAEDPRAYLAAGRMFERVWLESTLHSLAFQPVTGILFLARSIALGMAHSSIPQHFIEQIRKANGDILSQFGAKKHTIPAMLFRIGYAKPPTARSFRKEPDIETA